MTFVPHRIVLSCLALGLLAVPAAAQSAFRSEHSCGTKQVPGTGTGGPVATAAATRTIFLNKNGGTYQIGCPANMPGCNDATNSATGHADIDTSGDGRPHTAVIAPLAAGFNWASIVTCVRAAYQPYDIFITESRPTSGNYIEAVVGGTGTEIGFAANELFGIAAADNFCGVTERGIAFSFSETHRGVAQQDKELCATIAHEVGHLLSLEHEILAADEMSYVLVAQSPPKSFVNQNVTCGTTPQQTNECSCRNSTPALPSGQTNSAARLLQFVGRRITETVPPTIALLTPSAGTVRRSFTISATASDASGIAEVAFKMDGATIGADTTPDGQTYTFDVTGATEGPHTIIATASDPSGNVANATVMIDVTFDCGGCPDGQTCFEGECFVANGEACSDTVECVGGECATTTSGSSFCTQNCDLAANDCPSGGSCQDIGRGDGTGLCDFSDTGGCGCQSTPASGSPFAVIGLGALGLGFIVSRRRKR